MKLSINKISCLILMSITTFLSNGQCVNVLNNPGAEDGLLYWNFSFGSGVDWSLKNSPHDSLCFISSFDWSTKSQIIDLKSKDYSESFLDSEPDIYVKELFKGFYNASDNYYLKVELRDSLGNVLAFFEDGSQAFPLIADTSWQTSEFTFSSYGPGVRFIYFESGGKDTEYWSGFYGTMMDEAEVTICIPVVDGLNESELMKSFKVYPNPATNIMYVEQNENSPIIIEVIDLKGRVISKQLGNKATTSIKIEGLNKGTYILKVTKNNISEYKKFSKE